ncbi:MAG: carboxypeptidase regulatory-like domain-containing protein [Candidatus Acidoferrales bacterium]
MRNTRRVTLACVACLFLAAVPGWAQTPTTGQIAGQIVDPSGAVIPGAHVLLTSEAGAPRETTSDATGRFRFPLLPPGTYRLEIRTPGFGPVTLEQVVVRITETTRVDGELPIAIQVHSLVVTAEMPLVDSESATQGEVIQEDTLRQLPLPTRNFQQLLTLTPGTSGSLPNSAELGRGDTVFASTVSDRLQTPS